MFFYWLISGLICCQMSICTFLIPQLAGTCIFTLCDYFGNNSNWYYNTLRLIKHQQKLTLKKVKNYKSYIKQTKVSKLNICLVTNLLSSEIYCNPIYVYFLLLHIAYVESIASTKNYNFELILKILKLVFPKKTIFYGVFLPKGMCSYPF